MREALKKKTVEEQIKLTYIIENEVVDALHHQTPAEKYAPMLYDLEEELDTIERLLIAMEMCLVSNVSTATKRSKIKELFYNLRRELQK